MLAVNQDPLGDQASRIKDNGDEEIWAKDMIDGSLAVGLLNRGQSSASITATWQGSQHTPCSLPRSHLCARGEYPRIPKTLLSITSVVFGV